MLSFKSMPLMRRASILPVALGTLLVAIPSAFAQTQYQDQSKNAVNADNSTETSTSSTSSSTSGFASSTDSLVSDANPTALPAFPVLAAAAKERSGAEQSYGYGHGHSWSSRLTFEGGGGFNAPIGNDQPFITWGGNFTVGGGMRFTKHISALAEYQFIDDKLPGSLISDAGSQGGHAHIWSLTIDPVIDLFPKRVNDVYVTGGGGFYRKVTSFTDPEEVEECYYFCEIGTENVVVSHFSSNQGGANIGVGFTHRLGGDEHLKAFAEVRYLWINTPPIGEQNGLGTTGLVPVTVGLRF
jgi:Outer membrane protein beta-barrel domain